MLVDLHCHTTASDGGLSPAELVMRAENLQVSLLAITDHDTTDGIVPAQQAASRVTIIPGCEISTRWHSYDIHIVGLGLNIDDQGLQQALQVQREKRDERALEMGRRLAKAGIEGCYERAKELAGAAPVSRAHFARVIVERGLVESFPKVFDKYLRRGKTGYVPNQWMSIDEAIALIHSAGGKAVLAHPSHYDLSNKWLRRLVNDFAQAGGDGIEVAMPQLSPDVQRFIASLACEHGLLFSQGSDFHNPSPWRELGKGLHLADQSRAIWPHLLTPKDVQ